MKFLFAQAVHEPCVWSGIANCSARCRGGEGAVRRWCRASCLIRGLLVLLSWMLVISADAATRSHMKPVRGGTLRLAMSSDFRSLDPAIAYDLDSIPIVRLMFRGLLEYDNGVKLVPGQASDWNISPDGKTYTFHLKPGVKFANGREVEAQDYIFSFERILNPATDSYGQSFFTDIEGAPEFIAGKTNHVSGLSAPDKRTLIIRLKKPLYT
ncbi:MAG: ABC transporter substrate-binding protein, partial [Limisphaerales bacterium]